MGSIITTFQGFLQLATGGAQRADHPPPLPAQGHKVTGTHEDPFPEGHPLPADARLDGSLPCIGVLDPRARPETLSTSAWVLAASG